MLVRDADDARAKPPVHSRAKDAARPVRADLDRVAVSHPVLRGVAGRELDLCERALEREALDALDARSAEERPVAKELEPRWGTVG